MLLDRGQGCKRSRVQREAGKEGIPLQEMWCSGSCMQREVEKTGIPLQKRVLEVGGKKALGGESAEGSRKVGNSSAREVAVVGFVCRGKQEKREFLCKRGCCSGICMQREVEKTGIPLQSGGRKEQSGGKIGSAIRLQF